MPGDVNHDGIVNAQDVAFVASDWMRTGTNIAGDANGDGIINASDISTIAANWLTNASSSANETSSVAGVPEPSTLVLAMLGGVAVLALRRRRLMNTDRKSHYATCVPNCDAGTRRGVA